MVREVYKCPVLSCNLSFSRQYNLNRHYERYHLSDDFVEKCLLCGQIFHSCEEIQKHYKDFHKPKLSFYEKESAFRKSVISFRYEFNQNINNFKYGQKLVFPGIQQLLTLEAGKKTLIKTSLIYICEMSMTDHLGEKVTTTLIPFRSAGFLTNASTPRSLRKNILRSFRLQEYEMDQFTNNGSNWTFDRAVAFDIEISAMRPLLVGTSNKEDKISVKNFHNTRFLFNPSNKDNKCFLYNVFNILQEKKPQLYGKKTYKQFEKTLNLKGIVFPITIHHIKKFCNINKHLNLKINILYRSTNGDIYPYEFGIGTGITVLNLLLVLRKKEGLNIVNHFLRITDANKFLRKVYQNGDLIKSYKNNFTCLNCLNNFSLEEKLKKHTKICSLNKARKEIADQTSNIEFKNFKNQHPLDYIAFLDFECILPQNFKKCDECTHLRCKCDASFTHIVSNQEPIAFSFIVLDPNNKIIHEKTYSGENAAQAFIDHLLLEEQLWVKNLFKIHKELDLKPAEQQKFKITTNCYMCNKFFSDNLIKCRDHCHFTGKFLGAACQKCNLSRRNQSFLKIFLHNGSRYDFHFIIKALNNRHENIQGIHVLPYNGENFRTIQFNSFMFLDSMSFLQSSLAQLSEDLSKTSTSYNILKQTFLVKTNKKFDPNKMKLVLGKSFFPYEYCTSYDLMKKTKKLPEIDKFYSCLSETTISPKDHAFAKKVWKTFDCQNLLDYTELYCKIDTILLAEIFQKFRKDMLVFSGLDPANYISLPSFSFDMMLKLTKCNIDLPNDIDMIHFFESGIRGGVSFINTRHLEITKPSEEIFYIDANNLYGLAQTSLLPISNFKWTHEKYFSKINWETIETESEKGFILEVDLIYPENLHELHDNFPLAPQNIEIDFDNLSPYSKKSLELCNASKKYKDIKLSATFHERKNYVIHFKNLKLYLSLGMKLTKIHRVVEFTQRNFIAPFIDKCTEARQKATSKFEQDQFKKLANSTYGKTIQNVRNYMNVKIHTNIKSLQKAISSHTFKNFVILDQNLVQTNHFKETIVHDKPIFVGLTILELSKHFMYDFFFNKLTNSNHFNVDLGFSDTDSFLFKTDNKKECLKHLKPHMDFSNYPTTHKYHDISKKSHLGFFKDELGGQMKCKEFVGLRAKCYALKLKDKTTTTEKKVCKGLGRIAIKNRLKFDHYKTCLQSQKNFRFDFHSIKSSKQNVNTVRINKKALSHFDSKRWIFDCGIHSSPYGSILIDKHFNKCPKCMYK